MVWLVASMFAIVLIAINVCVNTLHLVNYGEAELVNRDRKSEELIQLGVVLLISSLLTGEEEEVRWSLIWGAIQC